MKAVIVVIVSGTSLLFQGCYSSSIISGDERRKLGDDPSEQIEINLLDGSMVCVDPYHYIEVTEPSDFVFVTSGKRFDKRTRKSELFRGSIQPTAIDSIDADKAQMGPGLMGQMRRHDYIFRLPDSSSVRCNQSDCFTVTSKQGSGLWCIGKKTDNKSLYWFMMGIPGAVIWLMEPSGDTVNGRIPFDQIQSIEVRKLSTLKTVLVSIPIAGLAAGLIGYIADGGKSF